MMCHALLYASAYAACAAAPCRAALLDALFCYTLRCDEPVLLRSPLEGISRCLALLFTALCFAWAAASWALLPGCWLGLAFYHCCLC